MAVKEFDDVKVKVTFTEAEERARLTSGENIAASLGKIDKYMDDLESGVFQGNWTETSSTSVSYIKNKPTLGAAASKGVVTSISNSTSLPTAGAVKTYVDSALAGASNYLGTVTALTGLSTSAKKGDFYRVSTAWGDTHVGDILIAEKDSPARSIDGTNWTLLHNELNTDTTYAFEGGTDCIKVTPSGGTQETVSISVTKVNKHTVESDVPANAKFTDTTYSNMTAATASAAGKAGLVPAPGAGKQGSFLRGDGTWVVPTNTTYSAMTGATASAAGKAGLVPAPAAGKQGSFLKGDGTWATPTNTTYSAGTGLSLSGTTFNHSNSITAGTAKGSDTKTLTFGGTFTIPSVSYDAQGHITSATTTTMTMPANPNSDTKNTAGSTDTSSKIFLVGATSQAANPQTYSHDTAYVGTDGCLYSNSKKVLTDHQDISGKVDKTAAGVSEALNLLTTGTTTPSDADYYICQYANGGTTTTTYHRRPMSALWTYIKGKIDTTGYKTTDEKITTTSVAPTTATVYYPAAVTGATNQKPSYTPGIRFYVQANDTARGIAELRLGTDKNYGAAGNQSGILRFYGRQNVSGTDSTINYTPIVVENGDGTRAPFKFWRGDSNGVGISYGDGGLTVIGAGEFCTSFMAQKIKKTGYLKNSIIYSDSACTTEATKDKGIAYQTTDGKGYTWNGTAWTEISSYNAAATRTQDNATESLILGSDNGIYFMVNGNAIANRKTWILNSSQQLQPSVAGEGEIGTGAMPFNSVRSNRIVAGSVPLKQSGEIYICASTGYYIKITSEAYANRDVLFPDRSGTVNILNYGQFHDDSATGYTDHPWVKLATLTMTTTTHADYRLYGLLESNYASPYHAFLEADIRSEATPTDCTKWTYNFKLFDNHGISPDDFKMVFFNSTTAPRAEIWAKIKARYAGYKFTEISQHSRTNRYISNWTIHNLAGVNNTGSATYPAGDKVVDLTVTSYDGSYYLPLSGGTMNNDSTVLFPGGAGGRSLEISPHGTTFYTTNVDSGWASAYAFKKASDKSQLGGFGAYGGLNSLSYHYIGGTSYDAPIVKITSNELQLQGQTPATNARYFKVTGSDRSKVYAQLGAATIGTVGTGSANGTQGTGTLTLGNSTAISTSTTGGANNARGIIYLYGTGTTYTAIQSSNVSASRLLTIPNVSGNGMLVATNNTNAVGSNKEPVYINSSGIPTKCDEAIEVLYSGTGAQEVLLSKDPKNYKKLIVELQYGGTFLLTPGNQDATAWYVHNYSTSESKNKMAGIVIAQNAWYIGVTNSNKGIISNTDGTITSESITTPFKIVKVSGILY